MNTTIGFIGKAKITETEQRLLTLMGQVIAAAGKELIIVPAPGATESVENGVKMEGGKVRRLETGVLNATAHTFIFADERLMTRLRATNPNIDTDPSVFLLSSPIEIEMWLDAAKIVLADRKITFPTQGA